MNLDSIVRSFLSLTPDPVVIDYCPAGRDVGEILYTNEGFETAYGHECAAVLGKCASLLHAPQHERDLRALIAERRAEGAQSIQTETACQRADGTVFWASVTIVFLDDAEGGGHYRIATYRDICDLKKRELAAQEALDHASTAIAREQEALAQVTLLQGRLEAALDAHPDPMCIYDAEGTLVVANAAYRATISTDPESITPGMSYREILSGALNSGLLRAPPEGRAAFLERVRTHDLSLSGIEEVEMPGDVHQRVVRNKTRSGDMVILRIDITEMVRKTREIEESRRRLAEALEAFPGPFCIFGEDSRLILCNEAYRHHYKDGSGVIRPGVHAGEVLRLGAANGVYPEAAGREEDWISETLQSITNQAGTYDLALADDRHLRAFVSFTDGGDMIRAHTDITELVRQRRMAETAEGRLRDAIEAFPDPFAIYDGELRLVTFNSSFAASMAVDPASVQPGVLFHELMRSAISAGKVILGAEDQNTYVERVTGEARMGKSVDDMQFENGQHYRVYRHWSEHGDLIILRTNVTKLVEQRRKLEDTANRLETLNSTITHQALHDELTGLGNRRFLTEKYEEMVRRCEAEGGDISVLNVDLDRFKQINDTMGHAAGDHVLKTVADRLVALTGPNEWPARNGGDEFAILIWEPKLTSRPADLAEELVRVLPKDVAFDGRDCLFGASVGVASTPIASPQEIFSSSDMALYRVKKTGRGRVGIFDAKDQADVTRKKKTADELLGALERSELEPYYQPQIDAASGQVVGLEALARWHHPTKGVLAPAAFIDIADELSVVPKVDRMIFEKAVAECAELFRGWSAVPDLAFNISAGRIRNDDLAGIPERANTYPGAVTFELLETIFLEEEDTGFLMKLDQLREMGISIEVDDFGSGRASVVALQRIGPDRLKIDRRLVAPITESESARRLVRSIVEIGNALEIGIVAEGVETASHVRILTELGVDRLQGFYFAPPLSIDALRGYLSAKAAARKAG